MHEAQVDNHLIEQLSIILYWSRKWLFLLVLSLIANHEQVKNAELLCLKEAVVFDENADAKVEESSQVKP